MRGKISLLLTAALLTSCSPADEPVISQTPIPRTAAPYHAEKSADSAKSAAEYTASEIPLPDTVSAVGSIIPLPHSDSETERFILQCTGADGNIAYLVTDSKFAEFTPFAYDKPTDGTGGERLIFNGDGSFFAIYPKGESSSDGYIIRTCDSGGNAVGEAAADLPEELLNGGGIGFADMLGDGSAVILGGTDGSIYRLDGTGTTTRIFAMETAFGIPAPPRLFRDATGNRVAAIFQSEGGNVTVSCCILGDDDSMNEPFFTAVCGSGMPEKFTEGRGKFRFFMLTEDGLYGIVGGRAQLVFNRDATTEKAADIAALSDEEFGLVTEDGRLLRIRPNHNDRKDEVK